MWSDKSNEVPLQNPRHNQNKDSTRDLTVAWATFSQTKAALRHIENKLEIAPTSTAVFDSVMDAKKPSASASRKISRKDRCIEDSLVSTSASRSSSQTKSSKEKSSRSPLRATTLESNVKKSNHVEFREPLASYRDTYSSLSYHSSSQLEAKQLLSSLDLSEAEGKTEITGGMIHDRDERDLRSRDFESPSAADETVVRYLSDRPAIDALQNNEAFLKVATPQRLEEEKSSGSRGDESSTKTLQSKTSQDSEVKVSSPSAMITSNTHRLEILKRRQHDAKLEKLKERIRKQWEHSEELNARGQHSGYAEQPVVIINVENAVTPKVRKVAAAPAAPSYRGFNPAETKIRAPDGKIWHEEEFHVTRDLYRDIALQLTEDSAVKEKPNERNKEKKATRPVRKVQKLTRLSSPESKQGGNYIISASSWREGQKLVKKILGPAPRIEQDRRAVSSDRTGRERTAKSAGCIGRTGSDSRLDVTRKTSSRSSERSRSKVRSENNLKKLEAALPADNPEDPASVNKDFLPMEIRGILDDLQLDSMSTKQEKDVKKQNQKPVLPTQNARSHSPTKRKPDKIAASEEPQVISKKRHYDTDEVRQYIIKQQEERKKKQNEEKKAQKEATEQKNKRLQELYRKQKEAFTKGKNVPPPEPSAAKRLQETYSKLLLEHTFLEEPPQLPTVQETQPRPGYQPSGESDKENKAQERPPSASSSSDMSLSEPQQPLQRSDLMEPPWVQPDRLSPRVQLSHPQVLLGSSGGPCPHHWSLEQMDLLSKECDVMLAGRRSHAALKGSLASMPQPYLNSTAAQQNLLVKPTANQYRSKLDRIEALKATAASLSSRIESEAKKLAGAGINYGTKWNSDHEFMQENQDDGRWAKAVSPPVREENEDAFSTRIQKMLGTCVSHTPFDSLPGVGNLSEFKKLPETIRPHTAAVSLGMRSPAANRHEGILGHLLKGQTESPGRENQAYAPNKAIIPHESSVDSISKGPLLSDGSLSEEEGGQHRQLPLKMLETLKEKDFCMRERNAFEPIKEFQKEAEKYLPLFTQTSGAHSKGPWEELAKGSPHSVINIFAKSYQLHGKVFDERSNGGSAVLHPLVPALSPPESVVSYEVDFASSQGSSTLTDKKIARDLSSNSSIQEEVPSRKSPHEPRSAELASQHSSGPRSAASSRSSASSKKRGKKERLDSFNGSSHHFPVEEDKMLSELEWGSQQAKKSLSSSRISNKDHEQNPDTDSTLENLSGHSLMSVSDKGRCQKTATSSPSPGSQKMLQFDSIGNTAEKVKSPAGFSASTGSGLKPNLAFPDLSLGTSRSVAGAAPASGCMRFSPAGLQHRLSAELNYLSAIEESVRQLSDVERVRGISLAQQESVSLAQILKAQQQRHERDLALLKIKAEQEALESQRQLEEARQKAAQVHAESLQQLVQSRQEAVQEIPCKAAPKQVETALLTTDTAHQICEMTELARTQISDTVSAPAAPVTALYDHQRQHHAEFMKQLRARTDTNRKCESGAISQGKEETGDSKQAYSTMFDSYSESSRSKVHYQSSTSSRQESPSAPSSKENEKKLSRREKLTSNIEEQAHTAVDDSLPSDSILSLPDEKDSASVATEYSLKFDESMTEDEIEEKSFRSLLPSESHRRNNLEKKRGNRDDSDEEVSPEKTALSSIKELSLPFSGGQDSFSKFTMEMVRQYMKEEEMRAAHQSSLLRLREKALKEKTKAELAWLEHQKKHLRDKGEDDKMPPIRKRQRGLLLRLQQEKAEIKRLQEANKAARKERQLILKQQAEIERIRQTTMKLQEKLKSAGENKLVSGLFPLQPRSWYPTSVPLPTDAETRSPSPISISSSETSSIMQKLKKMRSRMDEKFLTKREQKLMQRRQHAEELLEWKRRLDAEEAEIRWIEKQALAAWDKELIKTKIAKKELGDQRTEPKETASEEESPVPSCSHLNSESSIPEDLGSLAAESVPSETMGHRQPESPDQSTTNEEMVYSEEFKSSTSPGKLSPPKSSVSVSKQDSSKGSHRTGGQLRSPVKSHQTSHNWSDESLSMTQSETTSDQSDIEGRIRALKDELRKRKSVVYQLKKEQKKRQKERLKAQEASLIKQLESYDEFIKKTEAELSQDLEASPTAKPQIKTPSSAAAEKPKIKAPPLHRPETAKNWKSLAESERSRASLESISEHADAVSSRTERSVSVHTKKVAVTDVHAEGPSVTSSSLLMSPRSSRAGSGDFLDNVPSSCLLKDVKDISRISRGSMNDVANASNDEAAFSCKSEIQEDLEYRKSEEYELESSRVKPLESSDVLLTLDKEQESSLDILAKKVLSSENEHSQKELSGLAVESLHGTKEILEQSLADRDAVTGPSAEESSHKLGKSAEEKGYLLSEQLFSQKEPSYLEDFEGSSSRKQASVEQTPSSDHYKDDFEASLLSPNGDAQSLTEHSQHTQTSRSRSTSLGSDGEISEYLSDRSLSLSGSMHSDRLLELKSPTELIKNTERRDVEQEQAPTEPPLWASVSITEETDSLPNFNIGDRVLVSKVQPGTLRFKGLTKFAKGFWAGVELDKPEGNNNGTYDGIKYFDCREKHGIFASPQKISHITESIDSHLVTTKDEDSFFDDRLEKQHKAEQKDRGSSESGKDDESQSRDAAENYSQGKAPARTALSKVSAEEKVDEESSSKANSIKEISVATESLAQEQSVVDYLKHAVKEKASLAPLISGVVDETSTVQLDDISDFLSEKLERQKTLGEECAEKLDDLSPGVLEKPATPLLDLLTKEKNQLEAQLKLPLREEEKSKEQLEKVSLLTDSLLRDFVKDTVNQLQQIKKTRNEKIQLSNQEVCDGKEESGTPSQQVEKQIPDGLNNFFLSSDLEDEREELSSPDLCPRPESPVFGASGQEELAKRLAELELNREFLSVLGDDQDWFDEDYGLSSRKVQQKQAEEPTVLPKVEPQKAPAKPCEEPLAVPHTAVEVESMVHAAAEELWKLKELGHDLQSFSLHTDFCSTLKEQDMDTISKQVYKKVVFDLTREIFGEIFAEDPNLNQPIWMKPCRIASAYFRRVKDPNDLDEIKSFIAAEVLKLFSLRKEPNHKTDWQKMMKFGRKKRDRVDHILVQELHEEEAQWVNYDEDELCVKMQLADGIFEALIRDTVDVLNQINEKQRRLLLV
ncbi:CE350 protein, partial [Psophia crepitans]|nr:CE350 protein [Psophia crepitans]